MLVRARLARSKFPYFSAYVGTRSFSAFQVPLFFSLCWYALLSRVPSFRVFQLMLVRALVARSKFPFFLRMLVRAPLARSKFPCFSAYVGTRSFSAFQLPVFFSASWYALPMLTYHI